MPHDSTGSMACTTSNRSDRSGQISPRLIKTTLEQNRIRTIINLQSTDDRPDAVRDAEQDAARQLNIEYYRYPLKGDGTGEISRYADALQMLVSSRNAGKPVLIHCAAGAQRTGVAVAFYRVLVQNQLPADAYAEMKIYGWRPTKDTKALDYMNDHMGELARMLVERKVIPQVPDPLPQFQPGR